MFLIILQASCLTSYDVILTVMTALLCPSLRETHIRLGGKANILRQPKHLLCHSISIFDERFKVYVGGISLTVDFGEVKQGVISQIWCTMRESYGGLCGETQYSVFELGAFILWYLIWMDCSCWFISWAKFFVISLQQALCFQCHTCDYVCLRTHRWGYGP